MKFLAVLFLLAICTPGLYAADCPATNSAEFASCLTSTSLGDTITLTAGNTFTGPFTLPVKSGSVYLTIQSSLIANLPAGRRVFPADTANMAKVVTATNSTAAIQTAAGAHHYKLLGLEITTSSGSIATNDLITLGDGSLSSVQDQLSEVPDSLEIDRCYIHAATTSQDLKRGISLHSSNTTIKNSYISDFKTVGADSQAIGGWNGPGPYTIDNNTIVAAGENVIFGGAVGGLTGNIPSDITVTRNHMFKPLTWKSDHGSWDGSNWAIKNLFELKNARRVTVTGNLFENNWANAQPGCAILFTLIDDSGSWAVVEDVTFMNNIIRHTATGLNMRGTDAVTGTAMHRVTVSNNLFYDLSSTWGPALGNHWWIQMLRGGSDITVEHNTADNTGNTLIFDGAEDATNVIFRNNISFACGYGISGTSSSPGTGALNDYWAAGYTFSKNVLIFTACSSSSSGDYPANNFYPTDVVTAQFENYAGQDYRLAAGSPYKNAGTDGLDVGANISTLNTAIGASSSVYSTATFSAVTGVWSACTVYNWHIPCS